jgi:hypothetical protein
VRPDLVFQDLRGNVPTRSTRWRGEDGVEATVLARAGLERLALLDRATVIDPDHPAGGGPGRSPSRAAAACARRDLVAPSSTRGAPRGERRARLPAPAARRLPAGRGLAGRGDRLRLDAIVCALDGGALFATGPRARRARRRRSASGSPDAHRPRADRILAEVGARLRRRRGDRPTHRRGTLMPRAASFPDGPGRPALTGAALAGGALIGSVLTGAALTGDALAGLGFVENFAPRTRPPALGGARISNRGRARRRPGDGYLRMAREPLPGHLGAFNAGPDYTGDSSRGWIDRLLALGCQATRTSRST